MSDEKVQRYKMEELGDDGCHALTYCQVLRAIRVPEAERTLADQQLIAEYAGVIKEYKRRGVTDHELEQRRLRGIKKLREMGIIEVRRNGEGEWEPSAINEDRLDRRTTLITKPFQ